MWIVNIAGILSFNLFLAFKSRKKPIEALPLTVAVWIFLLYILAFFKQLSLIDMFSIIFIIIAVFICLRNKENRSYIWNFALILAVFITVFFLCRSRQVSYYDELGVWALETKSLFYNDGFADPYQHVAIEYGDYCPGLMLFMWWFCHLQPDSFSEGLMYVGYWSLFALYLLPAFAIKRGHLSTLFIKWLALCIIIFLAPSVVNNLNYYGITAELPMSSCFAYLLWQPLNNKEKSSVFSFLTEAGGALTLCMIKSSGLFYALAAIFAIYIPEISRRRREHSTLNGKVQKPNSGFIFKSSVLYPYIISLTPVIAFLLSWTVYCKVNGRETELRNTLMESLKSLRNGTFSLLINIGSVKGYLLSFAKAFLLEPLHQDNSAILNLSPVLFAVLMCFVIIIFYKTRVLSQNKAQLIFLFYTIFLALFLVVLLLMHLLMFRETQYYNSNLMVLTIARYGEPLFLGMFLFELMISAGVVREQLNYSRENKSNCSIWKNVAAAILPLLIILLLGSERILVDRTLVRPDEINRQSLERRTKVSEIYADFLRQEGEDRILFLSNEKEEDDWYNLRWLRYIAAPKSVVIEICSEEKRKTTEINACEKYHIKSVYLNGFDEDA